jgi:hypothetical protein
MKQIRIGNKTFKTQTECEKYTRQVLNELGLTDSVKIKSKEYFNFLLELCKRHPNYFEKTNNLVDFQIYQDALNKRGLALNIVNHDNTFTEISWKICVSGKCKSPKTLFNSALRYCISYQIKEFKEKSDLSYCRECKCSLKYKNIHIDHYEIQFIKLVEDFLELNREIIIPTKYNKRDKTFETLFKDEHKYIGKLFELYHLQNATLRVLCETCNLTREKYKH